MLRRGISRAGEGHPEVPNGQGPVQQDGVEEETERGAIRRVPPTSSTARFGKSAHAQTCVVGKRRRSRGARCVGLCWKRLSAQHKVAIMRIPLSPFMQNAAEGSLPLLFLANVLVLASVIAPPAAAEFRDRKGGGQPTRRAHKLDACSATFFRAPWESV